MTAVQDRVLESLLYGLTNLNKAGFKLMLRRDNFAPVGVVTVKRVEVDSASMMPRTWAEGVLLEQDVMQKGRFFREPLDKFSKTSGAFESTVLCENQYGMLLTSRRSSSLDDDGDNFMLLDNPLEAAEYAKLKEDNDAKNRTISSMKSDVESIREEMGFWKDAAQASGAEARDSKERLGALQRKAYLLQSLVDAYRLDAMVAEGLNIRVEAATRKIVETARERGVLMASSDTEMLADAADRTKKLREKLAALAPAGAVSEEELKKIRAEIGEISRQFRQLESKPSRAEKPKTEEKPPTPA